MSDTSGGNGVSGYAAIRPVATVRILELLSKQSELTVREISSELHFDRSLCNSILYGNPELFDRDDSRVPRWSPGSRANQFGRDNKDTGVLSRPTADRQASVEGGLAAVKVETLPRAESASERADRAQQMLELREAGATLEEIGAKFGLTRERARQILKELNAPSSSELAERKRVAKQVREKEVLIEVERDLREHPATTVEDTALRLGIKQSELRSLLPADIKYRFLPPPKEAQPRRWSQEEVIKAIQQAGTMEFPLSSNAYTSLLEQRLISGPSAPRIWQLFGSWSAACDAAGVESFAHGNSGFGTRWSDDEMFSMVRTYLVEETGRPTASRYDQWAREHADAPSLGTIRNRLGLWSTVLRRALELEEE